MGVGVWCGHAIYTITNTMGLVRHPLTPALTTSSATTQYNSTPYSYAALTASPSATSTLATNNRNGVDNIHIQSDDEPRDTPSFIARLSPGITTPGSSPVPPPVIPHTQGHNHSYYHSGAPLPEKMCARCMQCVCDTCKQWGLGHLEAKVAFDFLLSHCVDNSNKNSKNNSNSNSSNYSNTNKSNNNRDGTTVVAGLPDIPQLAEEIAREHTEYSQVIRACEILLPHLQSPALLVPLLAQHPQSIKFNHFLSQKIQEFLDIYYCNHVTAMQNRAQDMSAYHQMQISEATRKAHRESMYRHTPFNAKTVPLLSKYLQLEQQRRQLVATATHKELSGKFLEENADLLVLARVHENKQNKQGGGTDSQNNSSSSWLTDFDLVTGVNVSLLDYLSSQAPVVLLEKLEQQMGIIHRTIGDNHINNNNNSNNDTVLHLSATPLTQYLVREETTSGSRDPSMIFDMMVRLYFHFRPALLFSFVQLIHDHHATTASASLAPTVYARALLCLPPPALVKPEQQQQQQHQPQLQLRQQQVNARALMYASYDKYPDAIRTALSLHQWPTAIAITRKFLGKFDIPEVAPFASATTNKLDNSNKTALAKPTINVKTTHAEIFNIMLTHALQHHQYDQCAHLFPFVPASFTAQHLIRLLKTCKPATTDTAQATPTIATSLTSVLPRVQSPTIDTLKPLLVFLLSKQQQPFLQQMEQINSR